MDVSLLLLCIFAFLAGFVDSMAGGGGLIQLPALIAIQTQMAVVNLLAINKVSSIFGTLTSTLTYLRRFPISLRFSVPLVICVFAFSGLGSYTVTYWVQFDLKPFVAAVLVLVLIYTFRKKEFGSKGGDASDESRFKALGLAAPIGFYDGFFGPGTGGFFTFAFIKFLKMEFLRATALAKLLNFSTNLAAVALFAYSDVIDYAVALPMAICNSAGAFTGSRLALKKGNQFVRKIFLLVSLALLAKIVFDLFVS